jgi:L-asparaginase II
MANPVLVELTRGDLVESVHRGAIAIADRNGLRLAIGDVELPTYPRSSLKPIQALPLLESGAAEAFGLGDDAIALACASHSGEPMHTERVGAWLSRIELSESDLACGAHAPRYDPVWQTMIKEGEKPTRLYNNCSGKHTGFLTVARHWDIATKGYEHIDHPVQQAVAAALRDLTGLRDLAWGVDGCAAPNFALPLSAFARAFAQFADPKGLSAERRHATTRIVHAMMAHPELVSGTGRSCAILMRAAKGKAAVKAGAEGYYAGIVPGRGLGIALKIDDGTGRASETAIAFVLEALGLLGNDAAACTQAHGPLLNTRGEKVGERRPSPALAEFGAKLKALA